MASTSKQDNYVVKIKVELQGDIIGVMDVISVTLAQTNLIAYGVSTNNMVFGSDCIDFTSSSTLTITEQTNQKI